MDAKKIIFFAIAFFIIFNALFVGVYFYIQTQISVPMDSNGNERSIIIKTGEGVEAIAQDLENEGLIKDAFYFKFYLWQKRDANKIQAGKYLLNSKMTIPEIVESIIKGDVLSEGVWVVIPEGFTNEEIDERFAAAGLIKPREIIDYKIGNFDDNKKAEKDSLYYLLNSMANGLSSYEFLQDKPACSDLQGYLFPDTYRFKENASIDEIVVKMLANFDKKVDSGLRSDIKKQLQPFKDGKQMTIFEIITLASIIQKEVRTPKDMKLVAGVFYNRLNKGMPLEADSTLNFITGSHRDRATYGDLKIDSPYNTYKYKGLPPGPISNPGLDAIKAAIYPEFTDYFYFLTADEKVIYSQTYEEHLRNKAKWLN